MLGLFLALPSGSEHLCRKESAHLRADRNWRCRNRMPCYRFGRNSILPC